jgi:GntR family transcriptional regulator
MSTPFNNSQPIYYQLMEQFYQKICSGQLKPGDKLPSVRETAAEAGVNPNTVQRTYMEMERKDIVESKRGQGTFVTEDVKVIRQLRVEIAEEKINEFVRYMNQLGFSEDELVSQVSEAVRISKKEE